MGLANINLNYFLSTFLSLLIKSYIITKLVVACPNYEGTN